MADPGISGGGGINFQFGSNLTQKMPSYYSIFRYFCSKNRTSRNLHNFIDIPLLISQKIDYNCFLGDIADKFLFWSETPLLSCTHYCQITVSCLPLIYSVNYLKTSFLPEAKITFLVILVTKACYIVI